MRVRMWGRALTTVQQVTKEEWGNLDFVTKWLISTRASVLIMTFLSSAIAGLFALRDGGLSNFQIVPWVLLTVGLLLSHATNNLVNDYTDFSRGIDEGNYFRAVYGSQPLAAGYITKKQSLAWSTATGVVALLFGLALLAWRNWDPMIVLLIAVGAFFLLAYTWPLKHLALGEVAVIIVWGPLMIGGGYYVLTGTWNWNVLLGSLPYALGVTAVIFGKHIDKLIPDKAKKIHTLPVLIGETISRWSVMLMMVLSYILVGILIAVRYFTPVMAVVLLAVPSTLRGLKIYSHPRPLEKPQTGAEGWPLYFVRKAFINNKKFGGWFLLGLVLDVTLRLVPATSAFWK